MRFLKRVFGVGLFAFLIINVSRAQMFSDTELEILKLQDMRSQSTLGAENNSLLTYLGSSDDKIVIRALWALANISNESSADNIGEVLESGRTDEIKSAAAYALGQINSPKSAEYLMKALNTELPPKVLSAVIEALGFTGTKENLTELAAYKTNDNEVKAALGLAVGRYARRNIKTTDGIAILSGIVNSTSDDNALKFTAYGFNNIRNKELLEPSREEILKLTKSANAFTRMWAFSALGYIGQKADMDYALTEFGKEKDWYVRVNILNSLPVYYKYNKDITENRELALMLARGGDADNINAGITSLKVLGALYSNINETKHAEILRALNDGILLDYFRSNRAIDWQLMAEGIITYGMIFKDKGKVNLLAKYKETEDYDLKAAVIRALSYCNDASVYNDIRDMITKDVQDYAKKNNITSGDMVSGPEMGKLYRAFVETLNDLKPKANEKDRNIMRLILSEFIGSKDPVIIDVCINALSDSMYASVAGETGMILQLDYNDLSYPKDKEAMKLFIRAFAKFKPAEAPRLLENNFQYNDFEISFESAAALKAITGKDFEFRANRKYTSEGESLNKLAEKRYAILKTTQGDIKIKFYPEFAPFTVLNFIKLSEKGFYNKTVFHRVVPNFVIQGGDPLNTGWGGPDYTIRTEIAPVRYERGTVGMASDGKDTEGSQFFVTHTPFYHLDNRYTIFGEVVEGMDIVDRIYIGDVLETVVITEK